MTGPAVRIPHVIDPAETPGAHVKLGAEPIVKASAIEKNFDDNHVLQGCSMTVYPGETVTILGRSGSGKSTFLRCLNFLEEPTAGVVDIAGGASSRPNRFGSTATARRRLRRSASFGCKRGWCSRSSTCSRI